MPKLPRKPEEIARIRTEILDHAIDIIRDYGFVGFSMRRLATRLNFTAKTIYNYFTNKDEIYLLVLQRGFELLFEKQKEAIRGLATSENKLQAIKKAYVEFGLSYPHYYNIMFNYDVPKYLDYVGTKLEPVAYQEKQTALKCYMITFKIIKDIVEESGAQPMVERDVRNMVIKNWAAQHGIVSLINSRVLHEVLDEQTIEMVSAAGFKKETKLGLSPEQIIEKYIDEAVNHILED
ncbi:TetR/AcrR family transcriptional regulator [bacterium]|nr:TetR/AcrR family transcriptional regulator [bacterium]